tara:strand:- start:646 stop:951 length:306 start_codon:yes stop_codon:yes gene_type:complete
MLNSRKYKEHCPNPTFSSFWETDLRVYQQSQGNILICHKGQNKCLVSFANDGGKWFARSITLKGAGVNKNSFNYAMYIHHPLELINVAIANGHLLISAGNK